MERDFMGLNSKDSLVVVKEEAVESCKDSGFGKSSGVPWHVPNKVSALPPFMCFKAAQDEKMPRVLSDHLAYSGVMAMAPDAFDANHKRQPGEVQNFSGVTSRQQFIGGVPAAAARSTLPSGSFVAGTVEPWFNKKASGAASQLTIFYGGAVNVFDDITPEKAQAIMFLAGNGCISANMTKPRLQSPPSKLAPGDAAFGNQAMIAQSSSALSSPISVSSHPSGQSGGVPNITDEVKAPKTTGIPTNLVTKVETPKIVTTVGPITTTNMMPSAVPQFRKASLARFLEKRKERVMNSSPYNLKKPAGSSNPEYSVADYSATSVAGSSSVSTSKDSP